MQRQLRLLLIVAFLLVIGALIVVFVILPGQDDGNNTAQQAQSTARPDSTREVAAPIVQQATQIPQVEIVVAVQNLSRGALIPPDAVALFPWPETSLPTNALTSTEDVIGKRARTDIYVEQPILASMVVDDLSELADVGSDLAASIPPGLVAVAVPIDRLTSVAYGVQRGDRVDIIISALFVDVDEEFQSILPNDTSLIVLTTDDNGNLVLTASEPVQGRFEALSLAGVDQVLPIVVGPQEDPRPRLATQRTIQDALVMGLGDFPADGRLYGLDPTPTPLGTTPVPAAANQQATAVATVPPPRPDIATLAVTPQDAVILTYLIESRIPITFALRSAADTSQTPTVPVTLDFVLSTYGIQIPDKLTYSLQPAIRSIRQLVAGQQITLESP
ncbi:MAG: Flp pilus assembly protein CpaB [bacterium]|nr:Flp pilus assembly protein CpaB [bacterium]